MCVQLRFKSTSIHLNTNMKTVKDPLKTTVKGLNTPGPDFMRLVRKIQDKVYTYGVCSESEQAYLQRYCDIGQLRQKDSII